MFCTFWQSWSQVGQSGEKGSSEERFCGAAGYQRGAKSEPLWGGRIDHTTFSSTPGGVLRGSWCFMGTGSEKLNTVTVQYNWIQFNINSISIQSPWAFITLPLLWTLEWTARVWKPPDRWTFHWCTRSILRWPIPQSQLQLGCGCNLAMWGCKWWTDTLDSFYGHPARDLDQLGSTWICMTSTTARLTPCCKDNMTELDDEHHSSADSADLPTADADAEAWFRFACLDRLG